MQILYCLLIKLLCNRCLAVWYAMRFNIVSSRCLIFMLNIDDSKFLLFVYQPIVTENSFLK